MTRYIITFYSGGIRPVGHFYYLQTRWKCWVRWRRKGGTAEVTIREIKAKSILRKYKKIDSWFISHYRMNLYRGCTHNCIYCDGRSEGYYVDGEFGEDVTMRIPPALYSDILSENDLVIVILEHIDYLLKQEGKKSPYGFAAYSISQLKEPLSTMKGELRKIKGIGRTTEVVIREILETGSSGYYEKILRGGNE